MSVELSVRRAGSGDADAIRTVAERSMRASYDLSPEELSAVAEALVAEAFEHPDEADDLLQFVAERDDSVVGYVAGDASSPPTLRWLHVDPDYRGEGVGTALFERGVETLRERSDDRVRAVVSTSSREGNEFFTAFGFEQSGERDRTIGGISVTEEVYAQTDSAAAPDGSAADAAADAPSDAAGAEGDDDDHERDVSQTADAALADADVPDTVTDDGEDVYVGDEALAGTEAPFVQTYRDDARSDAYGYYCVNCGSTDVSMGSMEGLECGNCGNEHRPDDDYDGAYL